MKKSIWIGLCSLLLIYIGCHLELQNPYQVTSVINAGHMSAQEIEHDPIKANSLTPQAAQALYQTLEKTVTILNHHQIDYWVTCATLLGAVRHEGVIPLDDDLDLAIWIKDFDRLMALKDTFKKVGLGIYKDATSIKIYQLDGPHVRPKRKTFQILPGVWFVRHKIERFPTVDIHPMEVEGSQVVCAMPRARAIFTKEVYQKENIYPLKTYQFGPLQVTGPHNATQFLTHRYGATWNNIVYFASRHTPGTGQTFIKPLTEQLRQQFHQFGVEQ